MDQLAKRSIDTAGKSALKSVKMTKFKSDRLKSKKDMAPQSRKMLYTFVWWGAILCPHHTNVWKISRLCGAILTYQSQTWQVNYFYGSLSSSVDKFSLTGPCQRLKKFVGGSIFSVHCQKKQQNKTSYSAALETPLGQLLPLPSQARRFQGHPSQGQNIRKYFKCR